MANQNDKGINPAVAAGVIGAAVGAAAGATIGIIASDPKKRKAVEKKFGEMKEEGGKILTGVKDEIEKISAPEEKVATKGDN